ncbi:hypothetical protein T10_4082 [Trichinella papuae]|uniref:Uncharacterized protein n=1 Tax=Trichinella papuae TaxID=268474 RepID=A0A0V1MT63_9BILA|nr:hypothetical protein T10_4082 [Trichinella papuae]
MPRKANRQLCPGQPSDLPSRPFFACYINPVFSICGYMYILTTCSDDRDSSPAWATNEPAREMGSLHCDLMINVNFPAEQKLLIGRLSVNMPGT